jgi:hypothetical protein
MVRDINLNGCRELLGVNQSNWRYSSLAEHKLCPKSRISSLKAGMYSTDPAMVNTRSEMRCWRQCQMSFKMPAWTKPASYKSKLSGAKGKSVLGKRGRF